MLPGELISTFDRLLGVEVSQINAQVSAGIMSRISEAAGRGMARSGAACQMVMGEAARAIPVHAQLALSLLFRCIGAHGIRMDEVIRNECQTILSERLNNELTQLRNLVAGSAPFHSGILGANTEKVLCELTRKTTNELTRISGELDLAVAAMRNAGPGVSGGATQVTVHGPVGVLQTGAGSYGVAHQHIDQGARHALETALTKLIEALATRSDDASYHTSEVREMASEAQAELSKPRPNASKLRALVGGVGTAISLAPKLRDAYESLKWAANFIGVTLP